MFRLTEPECSYEDVIASCCQGITGNDELLNRVNLSDEELRESGERYASSASTGKLYTMPPIQDTKNFNQLVLGKLSKSDFLTLYKTYFSNEEKQARKIYDALLIAADDRCPYCGGIGRPRNLDHYLPKKYYPQFSVLPFNLVPSCRDCNMDGKGQDCASLEEDQVLHPYLDKEEFFNEQWVFARYYPSANGEPGRIDYFVEPPSHWGAAHKRRVESHFRDFDLGLRYSREAGPRLLTYLEQISNLTCDGLDLDAAKSTILQPAINSAPFANHWEKVMCLALIDDLV